MGWLNYVSALSAPAVWLAQTMEDDASPWEFGPLLWFVVAVLVLVWLASRRRCDFAVTVADGRVRFRGRFPAAYEAAVHDFFSQFPPQARLRILGTWAKPGHSLRLVVRGRCSQGEAQRIRNFLMTTLRP